MEQQIRDGMKAAGLPQSEIDRLAPAAWRAHSKIAHREKKHQASAFFVKRAKTKAPGHEGADVIMVTSTINGDLYDWAELATFEAA